MPRSVTNPRHLCLFFLGSRLCKNGDGEVILYQPDATIRLDERRLNIRAFTPAMKRAAYERQRGICVRCGNHFEFEQMQGDHIKPWSKGGRTVAENCQMRCQHC